MILRKSSSARHCLAWIFAAVTGIGIAPGHATTTIFAVEGDSDSFDLLSISAGYDATNVYLSAVFRAGTFPSTSSDYGFIWALNTDLDATTGYQPDDGVFFPPQGADFLISQFPPLGAPPIAKVFAADALSAVEVGAVPLIVDSNGYSLTVPKSLLGDFTGGALFALVTGPGSDGSFYPADGAGYIATVPPEFTGPPMTAVPEPSIALLLLIGTVSVATYLAHRRGAGGGSAKRPNVLFNGPAQTA